MSNFLAIATATATLKHILLANVQNDVPGANVTTETPDNITNGTPDPRVNIFLYQVTPNAAYRNMDLPTRRSSGQAVQRPQVALDLHYLITFYGNETTLEPQRLLGSVVRAIHAHPVLSRRDINDVIVDPQYSFLTNSNLADEVELVKFTPTTITLEELSKLWSVFFQIPYTLSVTFQGTLVLIESEENTAPGLPVRERNFVVVPFESPVIEEIVSSEGVNAPIHSEGVILIQGKKLKGQNTFIRIAGELVAPQTVKKNEITLQLNLPQIVSNLRPGIQGVQVVHAIFEGPPPFGFESNVAAFVLRPSFDSDAVQYDSDTRTVSIIVKPVVGQRQRVLLVLSKIRENPDDPPETYTFPAPPREEDTNTISFPIDVNNNGEYLVRLQIDGAESPLEMDENGVYIGPKVLIGEIENFELDVEISPANSGNVTKNPDEDNYQAGVTVELNAVPENEFIFDKWEGDIDTVDPFSNPIALQMDQDRDVTAKFTPKQTPQRNLITSVTPVDSGSIQLQPNKSSYNHGEDVELIAIADAGFQFEAWSGEIGGANPASQTINVVMDQDRTIEARFAEVIIDTDIVHEDSITGGSTDSTTVNTEDPVLAHPEHIYLAAIASKPNVVVNSLSGMGLNWVRMIEQCAGRDQTKVEIWRGEGVPTGNSIVTAQLSDSPKNAVIVVSRYSGVDVTEPFGNTVSANTNGTNGGCSNGSDTDNYSQNIHTAIDSSVIYSAVALRHRDHQSEANFTERAEITQGGDHGDQAGIIIQDKKLSLAGVVEIKGSFPDGAVDWALAGVELRPGTQQNNDRSGENHTIPALHSKHIEITAQQIEGNIRVQGKVHVNDEAGRAVLNASISVSWTLPNGLVTEQTAITDEEGIAKFTVAEGDGAYTLKVKNIIKSGFLFNSQAGETEKRQTI